MQMSETGKVVYERTYSRKKPNGTNETWPETVRRVVDGNLALVDARHQIPREREQLINAIEEFKIIPAGRHLWASGVKGRQYLFNCHVSHWGEKPSEHFDFTFMRLMEGGGVGANYSNRYLQDYGLIQHPHKVEIVCDPAHPDYRAMKDAGVLSTRYDSDWDGSFEVEDSREGWAAALVDLIDTFYREDTVHFHRVYDVSRVRGAGARLKTFGGTASGPAPLAKMLMDVSDILSELVGDRLNGLAAMEIDHALAECVVSGGNRRSARMAIMHWADPQIQDFIHIKALTGKHWTTNISVEVDDDFWEAVRGHGDEAPGWNEIDGKPVTEGEWAEDILQQIASGMLHNGEPGFWDSSYSNDGEPNPVVATNPCGEIALTPWENCNLGHVNLAAFVDEDGLVDLASLYQAHRLMTRFLMRATYGDVNDPKQAEILRTNRRIGVGHLGVASHLALRGIKYTEATESDFPELLGDLKRYVKETAIKFAHDLRIPVPVKTTTVAPTGTISKMPGVSEGIHPIFSRYFIRRIRFAVNDPDQAATLARYKADGYHVEPDLHAANTDVVEIPTKDSLLEDVSRIYGTRKAEEIVQAADDLTLEDMLRFQSMYQRYWADNAVSFTANVDPDKYTTQDVATMLDWFGGSIKGATIFPEQSFPQAPYERITKEQYEAAIAKAVADGVDEECASGACPIR